MLAPRSAGSGPTARVSAFQRGSDLPWFPWSLLATELAATHLRDETPVLFAVDDNRRVWATGKPAPVAPWGDWQPLDGRSAASWPT